MIDELSAQGISSGRILGVDAHGVPIICGSGTVTPSARQASANGVTPNNLTAGFRGWEAIPSVIRRNGLDTCRLEVDAGGPVSLVTLDIGGFLTPDSGGSHQVLRDDGQGGDRVAGDNIWTSVTMRANAGGFPPVPIGGDSGSPPGLYFEDIGTVDFVETSGVTNSGFLVYPAIGLMDSGVPIATPVALSPTVQIMPHLINIQGSVQAAQRFLRANNSDIVGFVKTMYATIPDAYDFLTFFSVDHVEQPPTTSVGNFNAGIHTPVKVNYSGTGLYMYDATSSYGSAGRLLGLSVLDTADRGIYSGNAVHEMTHQWCSFTDQSLGLSDGTGHYTYFSGAASLVGGAHFIPTNGGYLIDCNQGSGGANNAPPLDKYMAGFLYGSNVPPIPVASSSGPSPFTVCGQVISNSGIAEVVTIDQIQAIEGVRTPGPATSQHDFRQGFIIESKGRMLSPIELTFYEILARQFTQPVPVGQPDPYMGFGWLPMTRFWGSGTTWQGYVLSQVQPILSGAEPIPGVGVSITGTGFPRASYTVLGSTNLVNWQTVAAVRADTNGVFGCTTDLPGPRQYYRAVWNE